MVAEPPAATPAAAEEATTRNLVQSRPRGCPIPAPSPGLARPPSSLLDGGRSFFRDGYVRERKARVFMTPARRFIRDTQFFM